MVSFRRGQYFNEGFMMLQQQRFKCPLQIQGGGAPDCGSGCFSEALPYKEWWKFNRTQRIFGNFFETITCIAVIATIAFIHFPWIGIIVFPIYIFGRFCFGPVIASPLPGGFKVGWLCLLVVLPFYVLWGTGVGLSLTHIDHPEKVDGEDLRVAKWYPYRPAGGEQALEAVFAAIALEKTLSVQNLTAPTYNPRLDPRYQNTQAPGRYYDPRTGQYYDQSYNPNISPAYQYTQQPAAAQPQAPPANQPAGFNYRNP